MADQDVIVLTYIRSKNKNLHSQIHTGTIHLVTGSNDGNVLTLGKIPLDEQKGTVH